MADRSTPAAPPLMQTHPQLHSPTSSPASAESGFWVGQRVHFTSQPRRTGAVKYVGPVQGYSGDWVGVDWDAPGEGKHDGSHNGVRYFTARGPYTASFVRPHNLSSGISLLEALKTRYRTATTKDEEDEMYVFSARHKRVSIQLLGKDKIEDKLSRFEELKTASLSYLGVSFCESADQVTKTLPNLKELDLSGNLLSDWQDVGIICQGLPALTDLNISSNSMSSNVTIMPQLSNICVLVLNHTGVLWEQVEILRDSIPHVAELHLMENNLKRITPLSSTFVQGFKSLKLLNLEHNCLSDWDEIVKLSQLPSLEQLYLNYNNLNHIWYPECEKLDEPSNEIESPGKSFRPFENLHGLSLGSNNIEDLGSVDSLNSFPNLMDVRLSDNPVADLGKGGVPRFVFIARLAKVKILNGSEVSPRERKDSEIRYIRLVMSKFHGSSADVLRLHPRFLELRQIHGIDDEKPSTGASGPQKLALTLISVSLKCTGASMGEKPLVVKKLPATTTVGKLKNLCESFFKLKSVKPVLFLQEEGAPLPALLEDDMASLVELGIGNDSTILVDERP
ncbi:tubulin-folding cofactor E isoform X1 [Andrographis paniculata]|uniref:tubulin-folding cofactor E isoform X1 n=1 Tax=Andrographis paniculata TaxID=175694 RepID=UPI0021E87CC8|nr:tubulin-folding cofactor E isoform X1 [Andrographis paniculata]